MYGWKSTVDLNIVIKVLNETRTQEEAARQLGISPATLSKFIAEKNISRVTVYTVDKPELCDTVKAAS